ncbi:MAG: 1,4-alpha-glucan branching protein GlgB [Alphaproteobacteria bacterium]|uniref:1,4-alpha-glucan branching enzyme GlgB n=1 Tax=Candidatus Nitrobium versatile TaxID=2884831 RepID=A0A953JBN6_9BACT|nr:1,4-alpha-glucan branching protein GlgB [Candidatus Nitrobium versatile]
MNSNGLIKGFLNGAEVNPFDIFGLHVLDKGVCVRAFLPEAKEAKVIRNPGTAEESVLPLRKKHKEGIFELLWEGETKPFKYKFRIVTHWGESREFHDPYSFPPLLTSYDLHLIGEGTHYKNYEKLGAHLKEIEGIQGVRFAVWAPNAKRVSVVGDFNGWDVRRHLMRMLESSGVWEIFIPGLAEGEVYKFHIESKHHNHREMKADPFGFFFEMRPKTAAVVYDIEDKHTWQDTEWMSGRRQRNWLDSPLSIYEVHLGSWMRVPEEDGRFLTYRELADKLIPYVKELGFTHIELLPIAEHPLDASWGYQTIGYYAPTSRFGKPDDFMFFIDQCHQNGIGVFVDWVPAHFPKDAHGLAFFDGTFLYEHADPRRGEHRDWGTLIFNYGRNEVKNYLISNALFWLDKYHIDGLRVDAVASMLYLDYSREPGEWVSNRYGGNENLEAIDFLKTFNEVVHHYHPGVLTIAEESTAWPGVSRPTYLGGLGFSLKWNMGWMHDTLGYFSKDPVHRKYHINNLTFSMIYAFTENFILPFSHDEVVYGKRSMLSKMPGDRWQQFANLRALYGYMFGHPGKKLIFMGSEFGQWNEWDFDTSLDWHLLQYEPHQKLLRYVSDLNHLYRTEPAMYEVCHEWHGFEWIDFHDHDNCILSFIRKAKHQEDFLVFVFNLTPVPRTGYRIGVPRGGYYRELFNSDSTYYGGSDMGNGGGVTADEISSHERFPYSLSLTLPPLSALILKPE